MKDNRSTWYSDADSLINEVRSTPTHWGQLPEIPGCDSVVEIKRGGQGIVYRTRQISTNRTVAVKVLLNGMLASEADRFRFQREIEFIARLRHPHIVRIYDSGVTPDGFPYYVMEHVEGCQVDDPDLNLSADINKTLGLFTKICDAVLHAHQNGVIHLDLKPGNILIDNTGAPHILDFGIAKAAMDRSDPPTVSNTGQLLGSLAWASPEQIESSSDSIDMRSDVYSMGVILYQLLTGELPHEVSNNLRQTLNEITGATPPPPRSLRPGIPDDVETIILKCLAKSPDRRYQTMGGLSQDMSRYLEGAPIDAKRDHTWYVIRKAMVRHKTTTALVSLLLIFVLGFAITMTILYDRAREAEIKAGINLDRAILETQKANEVQEFLKEVIGLTDPCVSPETSQALQKMLASAASGLSDRFKVHPEAEAEIRFVIGTAYFHLGRQEEAGEHFQKAKAIFKSIFNSDHPNVAKVENKQAFLLTMKRRFDQADAMLEHALAVNREFFGEQSNETAESIMYLAKLRAAQRQTEEADALFSQTYGILSKNQAFGERNMLKTLLGWAEMLASTGKLKEANEKFQQILSTVEKYPKGNAWAKCLAYLNFLRIQYESSDDKAANAAYQKGLDCVLETYGPPHPLIAEFHITKGHFEHKRKRYPEAESLYRKSQAIHGELMGKESNEWARDLFYIAHCRWSLKRHDAAEKLFKESIETCRKAKDLDNHFLQVCLARLGMLLGDMERWKDARPVLEEVLTIRGELYGHDHVFYHHANINLSECLVELGQYQEGEKILLKTFTDLTAKDGVNTAYIRNALSKLVKLYTRWGKPDDAKKYKAQFAKYRTQPPKPQD